jgi:hypothetical protein
MATLKRSPQIFALSSLGLVTLATTAHLFLKIHRNTINILFSDQWDTYNPLFSDYGIWQSFTHQHGPIRLGVGIFVSEAVAIVTGWNTRGEAFVVGLMLVLIGIMAVYLKWRLFKKLTIWDSLIPMICLSPAQLEAVTILPFPAYSAIPVLLLMLYAICLTCQNIKLRYSALSLLNFLLIFSSWGFFVGLLTPFLLCYLVLHHMTARHLQAKYWDEIALAASLLSLGLFFINYTFIPAVECFRFPHHPLREYLWFVGHIVSSSTALLCTFYGYLLSRVFETLLMLSFIVAWVSRFWKISHTVEYEPVDLISAIFIGFSFVFVVTTAIGRVCLGECAADSARYRLLLVPAWLGLYFIVATTKNNFYRTCAWILILTLCCLLPQLRSPYYERTIRYFNEVKGKWKACYLEKEDSETCDKKVGMSIYHPNPSTIVQDKLVYLKQRNLNFFRG